MERSKQKKQQCWTSQCRYREVRPGNKGAVEKIAPTVGLDKKTS